MYTAHIDGASRGNPGPASYAVILEGPDGKTVLELSKYIGRETNNVAEYYGLITALDCAASRGIKSLRIRSDSELLVRQMQGRYKVKSPDLKPLHERAAKLARALERFEIDYVPREQNRDADRLANAALDRTESRGTGTAAPLTAGPGDRDRNGVPSVDGKSRQATRHVRAHYVGGVLVPLEPLDLTEGAEVVFELRIPKKD
jgi:ribonuclease HI